jgi:hypothetical protein
VCVHADPYNRLGQWVCEYTQGRYVYVGMRAHAHTHIHKHTKNTHTPANLFWLLADTQECSSAWMEGDGGGLRMEWD